MKASSIWHRIKGWFRRIFKRKPAVAKAPRPKSRICLIVGDSPDKWDDLEIFLDECNEPFDVVVVNDVGYIFPCDDFQYWVTAHPDEFYPPTKDSRLYSYRNYPGVKKIEISNISGTSAMAAVQAAIHCWNYEQVIVAGVSLTGKYSKFVVNWKYVSGTEYAYKIKGLSGIVSNYFGRYQARQIVSPA